MVHITISRNQEHPFIPNSCTDEEMYFETECCPHSSSHPFISDSHTDEGMYFETECCPHSSHIPSFQILTQIRECSLKQQNLIPIQALIPLFQILIQMRVCSLKQQNFVPIQAHIPLFQILTQMRKCTLKQNVVLIQAHIPFVLDSHTDEEMYFITECCHIQAHILSHR